MRRAPGLRLLAALLSLPWVGSALVILSVPPVSGHLPAPLRPVARDLASPLFELVARLPPDSLAGRVFYGTYEPLPAVFGPGALAAHAALMGLPWLVLAAGAAAWGHRVPAARPA